MLKLIKSNNKQNTEVVNLSKVTHIQPYDRNIKDYPTPFVLFFYFGGNYEGSGVTWRYETKEEREKEFNQIISENKMKKKTLKEFLKKHDACEDGYEFAKDLTLEEFLNTCERGDWILWLFVRTNPDSLKELTLAKGHCANTVRHLMKDERSIKAVDTAIAFGEGKATNEELASAAYDANVAYAAAEAAFNVAAAADTASDTAAVYAAGADAAAAYAAAEAAFTVDAAAAYAAVEAAAVPARASAKKENQKQTADICRKYLPLEIWNKIN